MAVRVPDGVTLARSSKEFFFDRKAVIDRYDAARLRAQSKIGAFVRKGARSSMKTRKGNTPSEPGSPPVSRFGDLRGRSAESKTGIIFAADPSSETVVVGPVGYANSDVPALMEYGGTREVKNRPIPIEHKRGGTRKKGRFSDGRRYIRFTGTVVYPARPFMNPALERERKNNKLAEAWADAF